MSSNPEHKINVDLARVSTAPKGGRHLRTLAWGDFVEVRDITDGHVEIRTVEFIEAPDGSILPQEKSGFIVPPLRSGITPDEVVVPKAESKVLKVNFVDVQQGDGTVIQTPGGKLILVDGGDNQLFARYLAGRFRGTSVEHPREVDCILVTHGDADHFLGLTEIHASESNRNKRKRLFIRPKRVYHNGLVKRPEKDGDRKRGETEMLGPTRTVDGRVLITGLEENLLAVDAGEMNGPFRRWQDALSTYQARYEAQHGPIEFRRLVHGDNAAFEFISEGDPRDRELRVEVLGPLTEEVDGHPALRFLRNPPKDPRGGSADATKRRFGSYSASHTINGHSIILRIGYGKFHFLFSGDLNEEAAEHLAQEHQAQLRAEVFKAPHHGSADFSTEFLKAVCPAVSVISSGDESARKEYIHPRANLVGALGKFSRVDEPLIFVTEMVAFFNVVGYVDPECHEMRDGLAVIEDGAVKLLGESKRRPSFFAFKRTAFGLVKTRTDGERLLVYTDSGNVRLKEAYAFVADEAGEPVPAPIRQV